MNSRQKYYALRAVIVLVVATAAVMMRPPELGKKFLIVGFFSLLLVVTLVWLREQIVLNWYRIPTAGRAGLAGLGIAIAVAVGVTFGRQSRENGIWMTAVALIFEGVAFHTLLRQMWRGASKARRNALIVGGICSVILALWFANHGKPDETIADAVAIIGFLFCLALWGLYRLVSRVLDSIYARFTRH